MFSGCGMLLLVLCILPLTTVGASDDTPEGSPSSGDDSPPPPPRPPRQPKPSSSRPKSPTIWVAVEPGDTQGYYEKTVNMNKLIKELRIRVKNRDGSEEFANSTSYESGDRWGYCFLTPADNGVEIRQNGAYATLPLDRIAFMEMRLPTGILNVGVNQAPRGKKIRLAKISIPTADLGIQADSQAENPMDTTPAPAETAETAAGPDGPPGTSVEVEVQTSQETMEVAVGSDESSNLPEAGIQTENSAVVDSQSQTAWWVPPCSCVSKSMSAQGSQTEDPYGLVENCQPGPSSRPPPEFPPVPPQQPFPQSATGMWPGYWCYPPTAYGAGAHIQVGPQTGWWPPQQFPYYQPQPPPMDPDNSQEDRSQIPEDAQSQHSNMEQDFEAIPEGIRTSIRHEIIRIIKENKGYVKDRQELPPEAQEELVSFVSRLTMFSDLSANLITAFVGFYTALRISLEGRSQYRGRGKRKGNQHQRK